MSCMHYKFDELQTSYVLIPKCQVKSPGRGKRRVLETTIAGRGGVVVFNLWWGSFFLCLGKSPKKLQEWTQRVHDPDIFQVTQPKSQDAPQRHSLANTHHTNPTTHCPKGIIFFVQCIIFRGGGWTPHQNRQFWTQRLEICCACREKIKF